MTEDTKPFAAEVWDTLSSIDVKDHISVLEKKKKGDDGRWRVVAKLNYLSWPWAWQMLMQAYPESIVDYAEPLYLTDNTVEIWCTITVIRGEDRFARQCWLPVMDNSNRAMRNPDARAISDTRQRCFVKCSALLGLGLSIYAGEDLPSAEKDKASEEARKAADKAEAEQQQSMLTDWTAALDECTTKAELRDRMKPAKKALNADYWKELVRWSTIKAKDLPENVAGPDEGDGDNYGVGT